MINQLNLDVASHRRSRKYPVGVLLALVSRQGRLWQTFGAKWPQTSSQA
jgi:hypothetical protein